MSKLNFKSQICTSREQSERLLALGLKNETADITTHHEYGITTRFGIDYSKYVDLHKEQGYTEAFFENVFPAWSLHRLIEMMKKENVLISFYKTQIKVWGSIGRDIFEKTFYDKDNEWDNLCDCIEWLIKEGYFNKEYLV